jgi:hypothetical protein
MLHTLLSHHVINPFSSLENLLKEKGGNEKKCVLSVLIERRESGLRKRRESVRGKEEKNKRNESMSKGTYLSHCNIPKKRKHVCSYFPFFLSPRNCGGSYLEILLGMGMFPFR